MGTKVRNRMFYESLYEKLHYRRGAPKLEAVDLFLHSCPVVETTRFSPASFGHPGQLLVVEHAALVDSIHQRCLIPNLQIRATGLMYGAWYIETAATQNAACCSDHISGAPHGSCMYRGIRIRHALGRPRLVSRSDNNTRSASRPSRKGLHIPITLCKRATAGRRII